MIRIDKSRTCGSHPPPFFFTLDRIKDPPVTPYPLYGGQPLGKGDHDRPVPGAWWACTVSRTVGVGDRGKARGGTSLRGKRVVIGLATYVVGYAEQLIGSPRAIDPPCDCAGMSVFRGTRNFFPFFSFLLVTREGLSKPGLLLRILASKRAFCSPQFGRAPRRGSTDRMGREHPCYSRV